MANHVSLLLCCFSFLLMSSMIFTYAGSDGKDRKDYIVYMGSLPKERHYSPSSHHLTLIQEVVGSSSAENLLVRSYTKSFNGFAVSLTDSEAQKLADKEEVVSIFPSRTLELQTTRSWDFMGLDLSVRRNPTVESNIIIGVIDSGIWPELESFSDEGFGPPPKQWKGVCHGGENFTCNNKLIGARYYQQRGIVSTRDDVGHGTHTASIAAGNNVKDASFFGLAPGTARGGVPSARIAAYKVCYLSPIGLIPSARCPDSSVLAAFDDAIADGVDIITISIAPGYPTDFLSDSVAIGSFHAMAKGITTTQPANNYGPTDASVASVAPWVFTVAASSIDHKFIDKVVLGNGKTLTGRSLNSFNLNGKMYPLIYGDKASRNCTGQQAKMCSGCLDATLVKGKIIVCNDFGSVNEANKALAVGSILLQDRLYDTSHAVPLPSLALNDTDLDAVASYFNSTINPVASILKAEVVKDVSAPQVAIFSSRGPNAIVPDIMKPDVTAPGVNILASYPSNLGITTDPYDKRRSKFNVMSGTSMSCPHVAGAVAYVKTFRPHWSPSTIKSALMTTTWPANYTGNPYDHEFAYGSGHIDPSKAINPGLVFEASKEDYITLLCSIGYDTDKVRKISGDNSTCPPGAEKASPRDLNYPSLTAQVNVSEPFNVTFHRTVTNVGLSNSTYKAQVTSLAPAFENITVVPEVLSFKSLNEKQSFTVTVVGKFKFAVQVSASLAWSDGSHAVRTPIIVFGAVA